MKITAEVKNKKPLNQMQTGAWSGMELTFYGLYSFETGRMVDVKISFDEGYVEQMLRYGKDYSFD